MTRKFLLTVLFLALSSCKRPIVIDVVEEESKSDSVAVRYYQGEALNLGIPPWGSQKEIARAYRPFVEYLTEKTGLHIRLYVSSDYSTLLTDLRENRVQLSLLPAGLYSESLNQGDKFPYIATTLQGNRAHYYGIIVVPANAPYENLQDLKGKTFAFVEKSSSSGYRYPLAAMLSQGIDPMKYFSQVFFLGTHDNVKEAVLRGKVDAGSVYDDLLSQRNSTDKLKVIFRTERIPFEAFISSSEVSPAFRNRIGEVLSRIDGKTKTSSGDLVCDESRGIYFTGFEKKSPGFYRFTRETIRLLNEYESGKEVRK